MVLRGPGEPSKYARNYWTNIFKRRQEPNEICIMDALDNPVEIVTVWIDIQAVNHYY